MTNLSITPSTARKSNGWAPVAEYGNGGRVVGQQRFGTMKEALTEATDYVWGVLSDPESYSHPEAHQCIDLGA